MPYIGFYFSIIVDSPACVTGISLDEKSRVFYFSKNNQKYSNSPVKYSKNPVKYSYYDQKY